MADQQVPTFIELARMFEPSAARPSIGIELECGLVRPTSGVSVPYGGRRGCQTLLTKLAKKLDGEAVQSKGNIVGLRLEDGAEFSLETGGALEYSSSPAARVIEVVEIARTRMFAAAEVAEGLGIAILPGGILPFTPFSKIPWNPKPRVQVMRNYFATLGDAGALADGVMGLALSCQVSLDYQSEQDLLEKLRMQTLAAPFASAMFVNSPIAAGVVAQAASRRMQFWRRMDPTRCGIPPYAVTPDSRVDDLIEWALALPMIYRSKDGEHIAAPPQPFAELLKEGFGDGSWPTLSDWELHLSQVWPHVRVRRTIEMRAPDGPPWPWFAAAPALWVGLTYDHEALVGVLSLLGGLSKSDLDSITDAVAIYGLAASTSKVNVREICIELVRLARMGLGRRAKAGLDSEQAEYFLDPLEEVVDTSITFAQVCENEWERKFKRRPSAYVNAYRVRP